MQRADAELQLMQRADAAAADAACRRSCSVLYLLQLMWRAVVDVAGGADDKNVWNGRSEVWCS